MCRRAVIAGVVSVAAWALSSGCAGGNEPQVEPSGTAQPPPQVPAVVPVEPTREADTGVTDVESPSDSALDVDTTTEAATEVPDAESGAQSARLYTVDVSSCEDPAAASAPIEGNIRIGTSVPLSGGAAVLFASYGDGQRAFVDYYNSTFGGVNGQQLELVIKDDQNIADLTVANVQQLVFDDQVHALAGVIGSPNNSAIREQMNALCIPQLWAATGALSWGNVDNFPWTTGLLPPYAVESRVWAEFVARQLGEGTTTALFYVDNEVGRAYAEAYDEITTEVGIEIVAEVTIDGNDSRVPTGEVTSIVAADPDSILAVPLGAQCVAFMTELGNQQAANPEFDALVYQTATCANPVFFGAVQNDGAVGVYTSNNLKDVNDPDVVANDENVIAYLDAFAATGSEADPGGIAAAGWESMELTVHAIQQAADAGNLSREGIINAARNIDYTSLLLFDGLNYRMDAADGFIAEGTSVRIWNGTGFDVVGDVINAEGSLGTYTP